MFINWTNSISVNINLFKGVMPTIMFIIFWDFLMFEQIFPLPQEKQSAIISDKQMIQVASWVFERLKT